MLIYKTYNMLNNCRQVSSSQWKKYVDGVGAVGRVPELSRHKTELEVSRKQRQPPHNGLQRKPDKKRISGLCLYLSTYHNIPY